MGPFLPVMGGALRDADKSEFPRINGEVTKK
jgi:hypothetical protein